MRIKRKFLCFYPHRYSSIERANISPCILIKSTSSQPNQNSNGDLWTTYRLNWPLKPDHFALYLFFIMNLYRPNNVAVGEVCCRNMRFSEPNNRLFHHFFFFLVKTVEFSYRTMSFSPSSLSRLADDAFRPKTFLSVFFFFFFILFWTKTLIHFDFEWNSTWCSCSLYITSLTTTWLAFFSVGYDR